MSRSLIIAGFSSLSSLGGSLDEVRARYSSEGSIPRVMPYPSNGYSLPVFPISPSAEQRLTERCREFPSIAERDRVVQLAAGAALDGIAAARENGIAVAGLRVGIVCGSARGATTTLEQEIASSLAGDGVAATASPGTTAGVIASSVAQVCSVEGLSVDTSMTCTSGLHALLVARALIIADEIDMAVVVGSEAALTPFTINQVNALRISPRFDPSDHYPCRPFSAEDPLRSRMVLGEGAVALVLLGERSLPSPEQGQHCRIEGIGFASESPPSLTGIGSDGTHFQEAISKAVENARLKPSDIEAVICHAPGTPKGDRAEWHALGEIFGDDIPRLYSTKWLTGHTYGASGLLSIELACLIAQGLIPSAPPFLSYATPFAESCRRQGTHEPSTKRFLINSAGFGGNAISVVVGFR